MKEVVYIYILSIHPRYCQLQYGGDTNPKEVGNVGEDDPLDMRIDGDERPDECGENKEDVYRGEEIVLEAKLKIGKRKVENKVECERQSN